MSLTLYICVCIYYIICISYLNSVPWLSFSICFDIHIMRNWLLRKLSLQYETSIVCHVALKKGQERCYVWQNHLRIIWTKKKPININIQRDLFWTRHTLLNVAQIADQCKRSNNLGFFEKPYYVYLNAI